MLTPTLAASSRRQIRCTNGSKPVAGQGATVRMFKAVVGNSCKVWLPQHRLIHNSQILKNEKILARLVTSHIWSRMGVVHVNVADEIDGKLSRKERLTCVPKGYRVSYVFISYVILIMSRITNHSTIVVLIF